MPLTIQQLGRKADDPEVIFVTTALVALYTAAAEAVAVAGVVEIGPNLLSLGVAVIGLLTLVAQGILTRHLGQVREQIGRVENTAAAATETAAKETATQAERIDVLEANGQEGTGSPP